uniref:EF-hand domain-containing protein n=1 Tax=Paramoeba aestuarina TaxID=180227 RepID=A0A7S4PLK9_9EUKA|mmetsp:Transcript_8636/g.13117  ORF Transcript_8636/g.13117 Transcript_8636/m.13117 type:complete len:468 (+) Transcript_8636:21-1424(+)
MADTFLSAPKNEQRVGKVSSKDGAWSAYGLRPVASLTGINIASHIILEGNILRLCEICGKETKFYCTYDGDPHPKGTKSEVVAPHGVVAVCNEECKKELLKKLKLEKKIELFHTGFRVFDRDGDGSITIQELAEVMKDLGQTADEAQLTRLVASIDKDNNGAIEFEEFVPLLTKMLGKVMHSLSELKHLQTIEEDQMSQLKENLKLREVHHPEKKIKVVVLLVVVAEEILPVLEKFQPNRNEELEGELLKLAKVFTTTIKKEGEEGGDSYTLHVLQVADSSLYNRHYSGYTQSSAIVSITAKVINPDLLVSFGTAGGTVGKVKVGDAVLANGCVFVDRTRTSSKSSHDWGVFGGPTMPTTKLAAKLGLYEGLVGSQISYNITELQENLIDILGICAIDMEAAPEAQIAMQIPLNFIAIKVVSNGIYPGDGAKMEKEYVDHKLQVSQKGVEVLGTLFDFLIGKCIKDL